MAEDQPNEDQKTEDPTPRRLEEARKKGQVALSREVNTWLMLLMATLLVAFYGSDLLWSIAGVARAFLEQSYTTPSYAFVMKGLAAVGVALALPFVFLMATGIAGPFLQVGPLFSTETLMPNMSKISPVAGWGRIFSGRALVEFGKGLFKIGAIGVAGYLSLAPFMAGVEHMVGMGMDGLMPEILFLTLRLMTTILMVLLVLAVADMAYVRFSHYKKMRMSKQEIRDELRQSEGDPMIRARLRSLRAQKARGRMMAAVPTADVVITNPTHYAIALKYDMATMAAPRCVAKGADHMAQRIRELAAQSGVEIVQNPPLARALYDAMDIDDTIPPEQYRAVAEIISYIFRKQGRLPS